MKLASEFSIPEPLPVHTGIKGRQVRPLIRFLLRSRVDEKSADLHKAFHLCFVPGWRNGAISGVSPSPRQGCSVTPLRVLPNSSRWYSRFGEAQVDLFASPESSHCQLYFSLTEGPLGTDALAHSWPRALRKYAFPPVSLLAQTLCKLTRRTRSRSCWLRPIGPPGPGFPNSFPSRQHLHGLFL